MPLLDPPGEREGHTPLQCVLAEDGADGTLLGFARYSTRMSWEHAGPSGDVRVREVLASAPEARSALWAYLLDLDLTDTVVAANLPVDDPLLHLVSDPRRLRSQLSDALFVRLVEVGDALRSRHYAAPVDLVLEVADEFCPWNTGRWHLHAAGPEKPPPASRPRRRPTWRSRCASWARRTWAASHWPRWRRPGWSGSCARGPWPRPRRRSAGRWRPGCRTTSDGPWLPLDF